MVFGMELTISEDHLAAKTTGNTLPPSIYEISDRNLMLKSLLLNEVKVNITIDVLMFLV